MKKRFLLLLCCVLLLSGCGASGALPEAETTEAVEVGFPDGDPETAACLGNYTVDPQPDAVVARVGEARLTNRELQAWYWAEVARFRASDAEGPDFGQPLEYQACGEAGVTTWQQYFLKEALNTWHTVQALIAQGAAEGVPTEEKYKPIQGNYEKYMDEMPAAEFLYGYHESFQPNTMHQAFLEDLPGQLDALAKQFGYDSGEELAAAAMGTDRESLLSFARDYNLAYMYFTSLSYLLEPTQEQIALYMEAGEEEPLVDFRHILCTGETPEDALWEAQKLLEQWDKDWLASESSFAQLAHDHSQDQGSAGEGGLYRRVTQAQLPEELARWCFAEGRSHGDTTVLETEHGAHAVYFVNRTSSRMVRAEQRTLEEQQKELLMLAREKYPMEVTYEKIALVKAEGTLDHDALLYPDLAHERFPEVPLYLQQDYPGVMYGGYQLRTNGCGITSFAMIASYLADEELTPPEMCDMFGRYSLNDGTDSSLFVREPAGLGFYFKASTYNWEEAKAYMEQGYPCVVLQHAGYWTRGGHYLVLEKILEDGQVLVRDSNIFNYSRIREGHLLDRFPWSKIHPNSSGYWIFDYKSVTNLACTRCGTEEGQNLCSGYLCPKCQEALLRRNTYLAGV